MNHPKKMLVADFFCGCGGLGLGFHNEGYDVVLANDIWDEALNTHKLNFPNTKHMLGDLSNEKFKKEICEQLKQHQIDVFIGGPPCQSFSMAGKRNPTDPRGKLFFDYIDVVNRVRPKIVVAENVKGILTMAFNGTKVSSLITNAFKDAGYTTEFRLLNAADYGVPQKRKRVIFIAVRNDIDIEPSELYPIKTHTPEQYKTVYQAIDDLKDVPDNKLLHHVRTKHKEYFIQKIQNTKFGESATPKYKEAFFKLFPNKPALTVKGCNGGVFLHYAKNRCMTPRELARLQLFKDTFLFFGSKGSVYTQIGNAVPVGLSQAIAHRIASVMKKRPVKKQRIIL